MAERDLARNGEKADQTQCPGRTLRIETDLRQVFRLVDLHGVPGEERAEITQRQPTETRSAHGLAEGPVAGSPAVCRDMGDRGPGPTLRFAVGLEPQLGRLASQQQIYRR